MTIYFDMDGTIANLYNVTDWLNYLRNFNSTPYQRAAPLLNFSAFAKLLRQVQKAGYEIGIITWGAKVSNLEYDMEVERAKRAWLMKHLPSIEWQEFHFLPYGVDKNIINSGDDILFDDEEYNRISWSGKAYEPQNIMMVLRALI